MLTLLPEKKLAIPPLTHFPTPWQAVVFRNYGLVPAQRIAEVLGTDAQKVRREAERLGLPPAEGLESVWRRRGYLTILRNNWNLLNYKQLMHLADMDEQELAYILKEDDFFGYKMGGCKPALSDLRYEPLTAEQSARTDEAACFLRETFGGGRKGEQPFAFMERYERSALRQEKAIPDSGSENGRFSLRMVHTCFGAYGDMGDGDFNPYPDGLLSALAKKGVNAVWLHAVLYKLVPFEFEPALSEGWEKRIAALGDIIARAARFGIRLFLYLNEPRAMPGPFFDRFPHLRGTEEAGQYSLCTAQPEVKSYLSGAVRRLFTELSGLGGVFLITMSENLTNCWSRRSDHMCPRCAERKPAEAVAEVNNLIIEAAKSVSPDARVISWAWGWDPAWREECIALLDSRAELMTNSEEKMPIRLAGVEGEVADYTMSIPGPGEHAKKAWRAAAARGLKTLAKTQVNNTWECSAVPFIPVPTLVERHLEGLAREGVDGLMLSWTLGGSPSLHLELVREYACSPDGARGLLSHLCERKFDRYADGMLRAFQNLGEAFTEFPFCIGVAYVAPQNFGPSNLLYPEPTGMRATMIGCPWDDLDTWASIYGRKRYIDQMKKLCEKWNGALERFQEIPEGENAEIDSIMLYARAAGVHFESAKNQAAFVDARDSGDRDGMITYAAAELAAVKKLYQLTQKDSVIGFEASNHYYYSPNNLYEKALCCKHLLDTL